MEDKLKYWKGFKLGDLFEFKVDHIINKPTKDLDNISSDSSNRIALITSSEKNNGVVGYIDNKYGVSVSDRFTLDRQFGLCFYHNYTFATIPGIYSFIFKPMPNLDNYSGNFIATLIYKIAKKSGIFGFTYPFSQARFKREIILLPVVSCKATESIWEDIDEDGNITYLTLDVEYIKELMETAKKRKEEKTIRYYEAEKAKYEAEKAKYENDSEFMYKLKRSNFKAYRLGDLFEMRSGNLKDSLKNLDISDEHDIAIISSSELNNGVSGYLRKNDPSISDVFINKITLSRIGSVGFGFFHDYEFTGTDKAKILNIKDDRINSSLTGNKYIGRFLAAMITKLFSRTNLYSYSFGINEYLFYRELILLPTLEGEIQPELMAYYYILGQERLYQNKINHYNQLIGG